MMPAAPTVRGTEPSTYRGPHGRVQRGQSEGTAGAGAEPPGAVSEPRWVPARWRELAPSAPDRGACATRANTHMAPPTCTLSRHPHNIPVR